MPIVAQSRLSLVLTLVVVGLLAASTACDRSSAPQIDVPEEVVSGPLGQEIDGYLNGITPFGFSGTVLIARDGKVILNKGYGLAIDSPAVRNTASTILSCGSVTKQFTAAAIMKLQMQGKLKTSDSLALFFDDVPVDKRGITLRQLLSHTAGLIDFTGEDYGPMERDDAVRKALGEPLRFLPGTDYAYSNAGYSVLAAVIERVSGEGYEDFLYENLFAPAGITVTGYRRPNWEDRVVAHWYAGERDFGTPLEKPYPSWNLVGNGDMLSTTADMFRWHLALANGSILDSAAMREMYAPVVDDYGYGWRVVDSPWGRLAGHGGGSDFGSSCQFWRGLDSSLAIVVFCNRDYGSEALAGIIWENLRLILTGASVEVPPAVMNGAAIHPGSIAGNYRLDSGAELAVAAAPGSVIMTGTDQRVIDLLCFPGIVSADSHAVLNRLAAEAANAAIKGNWEPLRSLLSDRERRFLRIKAFVEAVLSSESIDFGAVLSARSVGTFPSNYRSALVETIVTVDFERGSRGFRLIWEDNQVVGLGLADGARSIRLLFLPDASDQLIGYHLADGKVVRARLSRGADGRVEGLVFESGISPIRATRVQ